MIQASLIAAALVIAACAAGWLLMRQRPWTRDDMREANARHYGRLLDEATDPKTRESISKKLSDEVAASK